MYYNSEILIIQPLRVVLWQEVLLFTRKTFVSKTGRPEGRVQKDLQQLYIDSCGISWPLVSNSKI